MPSSASFALTTGQNEPGAAISNATDITQAKLNLLNQVLNQGVAGELNSRAMTSALAQAQISGSARDAVGQAAMDALSRDLKQLATGFQFLWDPFCTDDGFSDFYEERFSTPTFHPEDPSRYIDEMKQQLGLIAELLHFIPARYHGQLQSSKVLLTCIRRLRKAVDALFPDLPGDVFGSTPSARAAHQNCHHLWNGYLGLEAATAQLNSLRPPVLHRDLDKGDLNGLFLNDTLMVIARIIIYGPARFQMRTSHLSQTAIYLLSGDGDFSRSGIGNYSNINYKEYFANYKQMIIAARGSAWHAELLSTWQKVVFPHGIVATEATQGSEGNNVDSQVNSPEEAQRLALGNELSELLQQLTTSEAGVSTPYADNQTNSSDTIPEANANGAAPRAMTSVDENVNSNDEGPGSGNSGNLSDPNSETDEEEAALSYIGSGAHRFTTSPCPRPSIADTEPDVPTASNLPRAPTPLQHSHSESNMHTASEPTPFVPQSLQPPSGDVLASGSSNEIPPSRSARANRQGHNSKKAAAEQVLNGQTLVGMISQESQALNTWTR
ncbi:hypothetical protein CPB84DRAFT_1849848 [Gymnopilus junonius]|uniref:Uncharacterized protein n=1 Tax=Gymnopilus junonius TaxID=109634 RepID=A0A9P5NIL2_GYMJU|nr:hypothetical protein CPB84DRAFT_1849848 [Gymnopilus junonius]